MFSPKVVVIGVGAASNTSSFVNQFVKGYNKNSPEKKLHVERLDPTQVDYYRKKIQVDGSEVLLEVIDTAGTDQFFAMRNLCMKYGEAFIILFSSSSSASQRNLSRTNSISTSITSCWSSLDRGVERSDDSNGSLDSISLDRAGEAVYSEVRAVMNQIQRVKDRTDVPIVLVKWDRDKSFGQETEFEDYVAAQVGQRLAKEYNEFNSDNLMDFAQPTDSISFPPMPVAAIPAEDPTNEGSRNSLSISLTNQLCTFVDGSNHRGNEEVAQIFTNLARVVLRQHNKADNTEENNKMQKKKKMKKPRQKKCILM